MAMLFAFVCSIPLDVWRLADVGSVAAAIGVLLVVSSAFAILARRHIRRPATAHWWLFVFVVWVCMSLAWSADSDATVQRIGTYVQLFVFVVLFWQLIQSKRDLDGVTVAYVVGAAIAAGGTIAAYVSGEAYRDEARYAVSGYDPNDLGVTLALGIPLAWLLVMRQRGWMRAVGAIYVPLALVATALTASRGAMFTTLAALSIIPASRRSVRRGVRAIAVAMAATGITALLYCVPLTSWERLLSAREQISSGTMTERTLIWGAGWQVFSQNWGTGVGAGAFGAAVQPVLGWNISAHNTPLSVATELGTLGVVLFAAPFIAVLVRARRSGSDVRTFVYVMLATWLVGVTSLTWEYRKATWFVLASLMQMTASAWNESMEAREASVTDSGGADSPNQTTKVVHL